MAWTNDDIKRSIRRYLSMTLESPPWRLRVDRREVRDEERPVAVVVDGPLTTQRARNSLLQGNVEELLPVTINLYPEVATATTDGHREARLAADQLAAQVKELFDTGLTVTTEEDGRTRNWAGPFRIPLWDYTDVPVSSKEKVGPEDPHDVLWIVESSLTCEAVQDPEDAARWTVICQMRVSVERPGRGPAEDEVMDVDSLVGTYLGEPPIPSP